MHLPQSAPFIGGMVLTLMTLPTIIISTRAHKVGSPSIRDAALGVGASRMQTVFHHVLPLLLRNFAKTYHWISAGFRRDSTIVP